MVRVNKVISNLVGGEIAPEMYGRTELPIYAKSVAKLENFIALTQGGARYRPGSVFVNYTSGNKVAVLVPFKFSDIQAYILEFTDSQVRFYTQNGAVLEANKTITAMTTANPGVFTSVAHGYLTGDAIFISGLVGPTSLNSLFYQVVKLTNDTYSLKDVFGNVISTAALPAYVSGGVSGRVYTIASPYLAADLMQIQWAQSADTMYITHPLYKPRKLSRLGNASWTLAKYTRTADPFTNNTDGDGNCPIAVTFTDDGRLVFGGTTNHPETFWGSQAPSSAGGGLSQYDNFTLGFTPTSALSFTLSPVHGEIDAIQWISNTSLYLAVGTYGSVRILYGGSFGVGITPISITAKSVNDVGAARMLPISTGTNLLYTQRDGKALRSIDFDYFQQWYVTTNKSLIAQHLTGVSAITQLAYQRGTPDVIWGVRADGHLLGMTFETIEKVAGWHRHYFGGNSVASDETTADNAKLLSVGVIPRPTAQDQLWLVAERLINGQTVRSVEYLSDWIDYPGRDNFYTGNEASDKEWYEDVMWETQKRALHLDMATGFSGAVAGTLTVTAGDPTVSGNVITFTSSVSAFTAASVGQQIWKKYLSDGSGGGRATITGYTSPTVVTATITTPFDNNAVTASNNWYLTVTTLTGLGYLNGETVSVIADGGTHTDVVVANGSVTLSFPVSTAFVGYKYLGTILSLNLDPGGVTGGSQSKPRNVWQTVINCVNSVGFNFGTTLYNVVDLVFRVMSDRTDRPPPLSNGNKRIVFGDSHNQLNKQVVIIQDVPLPCTITSLDVYMATTDDY